MKRFIAIAALAVLSGCQSAPNSSPTNAETAPPASHRAEYAQDDSLYQALGQRKGISNITEDMLYLILDDERTRQNFKGLDIAAFHDGFTQFVCQISGGPCEYTGDNMAESHKGMNITETEFNAVVDHLVLAMEKNDISVSAKNRLLKRLAPLHKNIVRQ